MKWVVLIAGACSVGLSFVNFLMFGISRFGINKLWLGLFCCATVAFFVLAILYSLDNVAFLRQKCLDFVGSEEHVNFA